MKPEDYKPGDEVWVRATIERGINAKGNYSVNVLGCYSPYSMLVLPDQIKPVDSEPDQLSGQDHKKQKAPELSIIDRVQRLEQHLGI